MKLHPFLYRARESRFHRWLLNLLLPRVIPFNRPHGFRITALSGYSVTTLLPYRKSNLNHIKGIHACAMATASEYTTGLVLVSLLGSDNFRIIMKRLEMDYHYQGKMHATATFSVTQEWLQEKIFTPLITAEAVVIPCEVKLYDLAGNHLTTGLVHWQIKNWSKVRTR